MATAMPPQVAHEKDRASPRLTLTIPIVIRGKDTSGTSVIEKTHTVVVNERGAKVLTSHSFALGTSLDVAVPHVKRLAEAKVVWLGPDEAAGQAIGIDLGQCKDLWGVESMEIPPASFELADSSATLGVPAGHKNGNHAPGPELLSTAAVECSPPQQTDKSAKLSNAIEELVRTAMKESLEEILLRLKRDSEDKLHALGESAVEQARRRIDRLVEEALKGFESRAADELARNEGTWQQTAQELTQQSQGRFEATCTEYQNRLAAGAEKVRRELARKLADVSTILNGD